MNKRKIRQLICAMTIGDGHISKREKDGALIIEHGEKQEDYMHWKADLLDCFFIEKEDRRRCRRRKTRQKCHGKYSDCYRMELYWKDYIGKFLRNRCYKFDSKSGKYKKDIEYLLSQMDTDLHAAIWLMDDGGETCGKYRGKIHAPWYAIHTCDFTYGQVNLSKQWFESKYGISPNILHQKKADYHYLRFPPDQAAYLFTKFRPYFEQLGSMKYKFRYSFLTSPGEGSEAKEGAPRAGEDMVQRL